VEQVLRGEAQVRYALDRVEQTGDHVDQVGDLRPEACEELRTLEQRSQQRSEIRRVRQLARHVALQAIQELLQARAGRQQVDLRRDAKWERVDTTAPLELQLPLDIGRA